MQTHVDLPIHQGKFDQFMSQAVGEMGAAMNVPWCSSAIDSGSMKDEPKITGAFRTGAGVGWNEHDVACSKVPSRSSVPPVQPIS